MPKVTGQQYVTFDIVTRYTNLTNDPLFTLMEQTDCMGELQGYILGFTATISQDNIVTVKHEGWQGGLVMHTAM